MNKQKYNRPQTPKISTAWGARHRNSVFIWWSIQSTRCFGWSDWTDPVCPVNENHHCLLTERANLLFWFFSHGICWSTLRKSILNIPINIHVHTHTHWVYFCPVSHICFLNKWKLKSHSQPHLGATNISPDTTQNTNQNIKQQRDNRYRWMLTEKRHCFLFYWISLQH